MSNFALNAADVSRLLADPSPGARVDTAVKIAANLDTSELTADQRRLAEEILRSFARDAAVAVRQAVADCMKSSANLPMDVAEILALDIDTIALPILQDSPNLPESFLMEVIRSSGDAKQSAIAARAQLTGSVVDTLLEKGSEGAVATLLTNAQAPVKDDSLAFALERFPQSPRIAEGLAARPALPPSILEYLVAQASEALKEKIRARPDYAKAHAMDEVIQQGRERATLRLIGRGRSDTELEAVTQQLLDNRRLTSSLVLRTLCLGDMRFFEACMAAAAKIPIKNARILIHDQGDVGLNALYGRTGLLPNFLPAIRHALDIAAETDFDGGDDDLLRYRRRLVERILTAPHGMMPEDVDYLLDKLSDLEDEDGHG